MSFDVRLERTSRADVYRAVVHSQGSGEASREFDLPFGEERQGIPLSPATSEEAAQRRGDRLYQALFQGDVLTCFHDERRRVKSLDRGFRFRLRLTEAPELARLPWELLYDAGRRRFLLHDPHLSLVRYLEIPAPSEPLQVESPIHVLVALAVPGDRESLEAQEELRRLENELRDLRRSKRVLMERLEPATRASLAELLGSWSCHVLHYIGHGVQGEGAPEGALVLAAERGPADLMSSRDLGVLLGAHPSLRLVVLNTCRGGLAAETNAFAGVAQALVGQGVAAVVAMQADITDEAALAFSGCFYRELAREGSVDRALAEVRRDLWLKGHRLAWAMPALFTRSPEDRIIEVESPHAEVAGAPPGDMIATDSGSQVAITAAEAESPPISWFRRQPHLLAAAGLVVALLGIAATLTWRHVHGRDIPMPWFSAGIASQPDWAPLQPVRVDAVECPSPKSVYIPFVLIQPGTFQMGLGNGAKEVSPEHQVTLTKPYCLAVFEVTQGQWKAVLGEGSESSAVQGEALPVTGISWNEVPQFFDRLNRDGPEANYRLPSEAQWEFAAREGRAAQTQPRGEGSPRSGNCLGTAPGDPWDGIARVDALPHNFLGLFGMTGNVAEWVADRFGLYEPLPATDPAGPSWGESRIRRGGAYDSADESCTSVVRGVVTDLDRQWQNTGFRIIRDPVVVNSPAR